MGEKGDIAQMRNFIKILLDFLHNRVFEKHHKGSHASGGLCQKTQRDHTKIYEYFS
jgi:hypothetical protein